DQELDEVAGDESMIEFARRRVQVPEQTVRQTLITAGFAYNEHSKRVFEMSGGERARLLFVVLGLNRPNFLILDEPTNHIDIAGKEQLETQLLESGATLLITSHDRAFLSVIANRFLMIDTGRLVEIAELEVFLDRLTGAVQANSSASVSKSVIQTQAPETDQRTEHSNPETETLRRIVDLEAKLAADLKRKPKFQKSLLQAQWREEIDELYQKLEG
ncbi:MAG: ATP-binding cassette domain-containing protein, partial [Proteobacteria bacterium]|nr:ATP-binding cassette domain-containing protein [Pseudomonadota bacterium]